MPKTQPVNVVVVGSVGIDTIETPFARRESVLGGSASYACAAASFFARPGMVGVVGNDFPKAHRDLYRKFHIDTDGLQTASGKTFCWSGVYEQDMNNRRSLSTALNVLADFSPQLPESYRRAPFLFLANISPSLQLDVLSQMKKPRFVLLDTMDLWINNTKPELLRVMQRVTMMALNESEARHLTGERGLVRAARHLLKAGPRYVVVKKGEHGSILFTKKGFFLMPAFPLENVVDPTGAGDTFAGGFLGALARSGDLSDGGIRKAMLYGSIVASFGVEDFSLNRLARLTRAQIEKRAAVLRRMMKV